MTWGFFVLGFEIYSEYMYLELSSLWRVSRNGGVVVWPLCATCRRAVVTCGAAQPRPWSRKDSYNTEFILAEYTTACSPSLSLTLKC